MARRKEVLLVKDVLKLGNMGDIVRVSPGFARNYLYPFGMAVPAEGAAKRQIEVLREKAAKSESDREQKALTLKKSMEGMTIQIAARVAHDIELFGSIGTREIVAALAKNGIEVDGKQIHLHDKLRRLGVYNVDIRLHKNVPVTIKLEIVNSDPNAPSLQEALAAAAAEKAARDKAAAEAKAKGEKPAAEGAEKAEADAKGGKPAEKAEGKDAKKGGKPEGGKKDEKATKDEQKPGVKREGGKSEAGAKKTVKA
jgi:large subunit ribosomal protein L9